MAKITTAAQLAEKCVEVAKKYKTLYIMGCFGAPMTSANKARYTNNHSYNKQSARTAMINAATADTFGFDCVCLIKGLLWGWEGDKSKNYGGATYTTNGVPDIGADAMIKVCKELSTDFSKIEVGEAVWTDGHIGIYVGDGLAVECTPSWKNCVQLTACNCTKNGYPRRNWKKHGKLPYVTYTGKDESEAKKENTATDTNVGSNTNTGAAAAQSFKVGDFVNYTGSVHYSASSSTSPQPCKGGKAKITAISKNAKHPYHLIAANGSGATVYGWVDADKLKAIASAGSSSKPEAAKHRDNSLSGSYKTTAELNMRTGAGTDKGIILIIPKGHSVQCYGYYNKDGSGTKWLSVVYNGKTGYCSSNYLKRG